MPHTWSESNSCVTQRLRRCDFQNAKMYSGEGFFCNFTAKAVRKGTGFVAICVDFFSLPCYTIR